MGLRLRLSPSAVVDAVGVGVVVEVIAAAADDDEDVGAAVAAAAVYGSEWYDFNGKRGEKERGGKGRGEEGVTHTLEACMLVLKNGLGLRTSTCPITYTTIQPDRV